MMVSIQIAREISRERAQRFVDAIEGKSFMNFQVIVAPAGGELAISVQTDYTDDEAEAQGMLSYLMYSAITR